MDDILNALRKFRDERGWAQFHTPKDLAVSVSIEAGELLEQFQWDQSGHDVSKLDVAGIANEAADVLLYTLMLFDRLGLDPAQEAFNKINRNAQRFPKEKTFGVPGSKAGIR
jgi:NTP pyrophosphatase (non-canonical NTP hydrolase)